MNSFQSRAVEAAKEAIASAELLITGKHFASAISRAYYAMFHLAQAVLAEKELDFSKHSAVIGAFGREFTRPGIIAVHFHRYLIEAQDDRLKADYDVMTVLNLATAEKHTGRAKEFLDAVMAFLAAAD